MEFPNDPEISSAQAFQLIVGGNVNACLNGLAVKVGSRGALKETMILEASTAGDSGLVFYLNGTSEQIAAKTGTMQTDGLASSFPYSAGVSIHSNKGLSNATSLNYKHEVSLTPKSGTRGVHLAPWDATYLTAPAPGSFLACHNELLVVRYVYKTFNVDTGRYYQPVPKGCSTIRLFPKCAGLQKPIPQGSQASHKYAATVLCHDPSSIHNFWALLAVEN